MALRKVGPFLQETESKAFFRASSVAGCGKERVTDEQNGEVTLVTRVYLVGSSSYLDIHGVTLENMLVLLCDMEDGVM